MIIKFNAKSGVVKRKLNKIYNEVNEEIWRNRNGDNLLYIRDSNIAVSNSDVSQFELVIGSEKEERIFVDLDSCIETEFTGSNDTESVVYNVFTKNDISLISIYDKIHQIVYVYRYDSIAKELRETGSVEKILTDDDFGCDRYIKPSQDNFESYYIKSIDAHVLYKIFIHEKNNIPEDKKIQYKKFDHSPSTAVIMVLNKILEEL